MNARRIAIALGISLSLLGGSTAAAQDATPATGGPAPLPAGCTVVASGLVNPRYVAVADDGTIYISEAGAGGDEIVAPPADPSATPGATPVEGEGEGRPGGPGGGLTRGTTGQVTMIAPDGTQSVVASGLPSYSMGGGPAGIAVSNGQVILAIGGAGPATAFTEALPNENSVVSIDPATGDVTVLADIGAFERANNPDGFNIDSNLYGIAVGDDGTIYVNDAGGNTTYMVPAGGGEPLPITVHAGLPFPEGVQAPPGGNPNRAGAAELDPVPTDVEAIADGNLLVGLLSGAPFPPGAAKVVNVAVADGAVSDVATGLTMVVGLAVGPDNQLYATQLSTNFLAEIPAPGSVVRVQADGTQEIVVDGLVLPNGIAFDQAGNLLVVTNVVSMGPPSGQLLSCEGVAATAGASEEVVVSLNDVFFRSW